MDTGVAPEMRGVCSGSRSARAIHTTRGKQKRFPYYPSRQERRIFKYVFFHHERSFWVKRYEDVKLVGTYIAAAVNVGAILFNWLDAHQNNDPFDSTTDFCVYFLAVAEALVIAFAVCAVMYYCFTLGLFCSGQLGWPFCQECKPDECRGGNQQGNSAESNATEGLGARGGRVEPGVLARCAECALNYWVQQPRKTRLPQRRGKVCCSVSPPYAPDLSLYRYQN